MATPGGAGDASTALSPGPPAATASRGSVGGGTLLGRGYVPVGCGAHVHWAQGRTRWPRWATLGLGSAGLWLQASLGVLSVPPRHSMAPAANCRGLSGCSMSPPWHPMAPAAAPLPRPGVPRTPHVPLLFCSAGMEPVRGPGPARPTHPLPAASRPGRTLGCGSLPPRRPDTTAMGSPGPCRRCCSAGAAFPDPVQLP